MSTLAKRENTNEGPAEETTRTPVGDKKAKAGIELESAIGSKTCSLCSVAFETVEEQRSHIRSDLHGYNLKQRMRGAKPVSEEDFEKLVGGIIILLLPRVAILTFPRSG